MPPRSFAPAQVGDADEMSLSDLDAPQPPRKNPIPPRSTRFTLLAQRSAIDDSQDADADESYMDEEELTEVIPEGDLGEPQPDDPDPGTSPTEDEHTLTTEDVDLDPTGNIIPSTPKTEATPSKIEKEAPVAAAEPASTTPLRPPMSEDDRLRQQLYELQRVNEAFDSFGIAVQAVRFKQRSLESRVGRTKELLDRYVAILGQAEHNSRLLLNPDWEGASADEMRIEEARRREEEARLAREEALRREREEQERREAEARDAAERAAQAKERGRGTTVRGRGRAAPSVRSRTPTLSATRTSPNIGTTAGSSIRGRGKTGIPSVSGIRPPVAGRGVRGTTAAGRGRGST
ncbi:hypothetical protein DL93DRAFT_1173766 [Clavulina sp. PMI_390]|nr:hypothetical protein DL93DRAFT_1173766 [Clavulina sp. PMI_390]